MRALGRIAVLALSGLWASPALAATMSPVGVPARAVPAPTVAAPAPPAADGGDVKVPAGSYYVGRATGDLDYRKLANATTPGFMVMRGEVTQGLFAEIVAWGTLHGYAFEDACKTCDRSHDDKPVATLSWRDAALLANALSERAGLDAVYRDQAGQPVREATGIDRAVVEPTLTGYRLPTIPEWQIALRGADKALVDGSYGGPAKAPNALGLIDTAGPLGEWTASSMDPVEGKRQYFHCNETVDGAMRLSNCGQHAPGWADATVGVRLVRKLTR
jgi:formylglycine-generating enzyme required for sulfatase activity